MRSTKQLRIVVLFVSLLPLLSGQGCPSPDTNGSGSQGPPGQDGQLRIYGDGTAGAKTVTTSELLSDTNLQYTDVTVNAGATLTVESGTVIRCTGTFTNNGTIIVQAGSSGGALDGTFDANGYPGFGIAEPGIALRAAESGELGSNATSRIGGRGGRGLSDFQARWMLEPGPFGGGGGAGNQLGAGFGGRGGGTFTVLAKTAIVNNSNALITANGGNGGTGAGGGGGGIVILASPGTITNGGTIEANGGNGGPSAVNCGPGGGGTGGIINLLAPTINAAGGTLTVAGGTAGTISGNVTASPRQGGGGGGACAGGDTGGDGGDIPAGASVGPGSANAGGPGSALLTSVDPTALF